MTNIRGIIRKASSRSAKRIQGSGEMSFMNFFSVVGIHHARAVCGQVEIVDRAGVLYSLGRVHDEAGEERVALDG